MASVLDLIETNPMERAAVEQKYQKKNAIYAHSIQQHAQPSDTLPALARAGSTAPASCIGDLKAGNLLIETKPHFKVVVAGVGFAKPHTDSTALYAIGDTLPTLDAGRLAT